MYVGCNMVVVANVDNGGGSLVGWSVGGRLPPSAPSPLPPHVLPVTSRSPSLPPSLAPVLRLSRPFLRSQGKTLKSQQWSQREMGKKGRGMEHRGFRVTRNVNEFSYAKHKIRQAAALHEYR